MDEAQARALGKLLRDKRLKLGYSTHDVARAANVAHSTVVRFEQGRFAAPRPNRLARFAELLGLSLADLYARAGYLVPDELPSFEPYLLVKYPKLPKRAVSELRKHFTKVAANYGFSLDQSKPPTREVNDETKRRAAS